MISRSTAVGILFAAVFFGYPALATLMSTLGLGDARAPSVAFRVAVAAAAFVTFWANRESLRIVAPSVTIAFAVFWAAYLYRIISDGYIVQVEMPISAPDLLAYSVLFSLIPALVGLIGINVRSSEKAFNYAILLAAATTLLMLVETQRLMFTVLSEGTSRFYLEKLNPIAVSTTGASLLLMALAGMFNRHIGTAAVKRVMYVVFILAGLAAMLAGASRGPFVAVGVAFVAFAIAPMRGGRLLTSFAVFGVGAVALTAMYQFSVNQFSFDVLERFLFAAGGYDMSTTVRQESIAGGFQQFLNNPVFGDSINESIWGNYPHNAIIEALMATGIVGGGAYLFILFVSGIAALRLIARREGYEWLALLSIQFAVLAQVTGAHWVNGPHWLAMFAVVVTEIKSRRRPVIHVNEPILEPITDLGFGEQGVQQNLSVPAPIEASDEIEPARPNVKGFPVFSTGAVPERRSPEGDA